MHQQYLRAAQDHRPCAPLAHSTKFESRAVGLLAFQTNINLSETNSAPSGRAVNSIRWRSLQPSEAKAKQVKTVDPPVQAFCSSATFSMLDTTTHTDPLKARAIKPEGRFWSSL